MTGHVLIVERNGAKVGESTSATSQTGASSVSTGMAQRLTPPCRLTHECPLPRPRCQDTRGREQKSLVSEDLSMFRRPDSCLVTAQPNAKVP
jgi:hypothetical protein